MNPLYCLQMAQNGSEADDSFKFLGIFSTPEKAKKHAKEYADIWFHDDNDNPIPLKWKEIYYDGQHWLSNQGALNTYFTIEEEYVDAPNN